MADILLAILIVLSFLITALLMPYWIRKAHQIRLVWKDMNKYSHPLVAGSGGIIVTGAFVVSILFFIAYRVFYLHTTGYLIEILSLLVTVILLGSIGFMDDLFGWQRGGLSRRSRIILVLLACLPLVVINAGRSGMEIPFIGTVDVGIIYPLVIIPLGIVGASTTFNFLAGFNGLEAGQGILMLGALSLVAYLTGNSWLSVIGLCMVATLCGFLLFNLSPARVFPGDCLTYPVGGMIAIIAILGNFEKIALFFFIPVIIEVVLKSRGAFVKQSFGNPQKDGSIDVPYERVYGLTHASILLQKKMNLVPNERRTVYFIWLFQLAIILLGLIVFSKGLFL